MRRSLKKMFGKRFRAGGYAALAAAIVIAIAVAANLLVCALPSSATQLDLTSQSLYTLSDQTRRIVTALDREVYLYLLSTTGYEDSGVTRLLDRYAALSDQIVVEYIDPAVRPTFLDDYDLEVTQLYANSVLVVCGDRFRLVGYDDIYVTEYSMDYYSYSYTSTTNFDGENALTNAIHYVSSDDLPVVYALNGHGESELSESLTEMIAQDNLTLEDLSLLSLESVPEDAGAVLINAPTSDLSEDEAAMLIAYLENGGGVTLITGYMDIEDMPNLLSVTQTMGLTAGDGLIIEGDLSKSISRYPYYLLPDIASHTITEPLTTGRYYVMMPMAQPLLETEDSQASVTWLLTTSDQAYAKAAGMEITTTEKEDGDTEGPFYVGAASELGEGKLVWYSSTDMLQQQVDAMVSGANGNLFMNTLNWMCEQEETISIRAKSLHQSGLTLTSAESNLWSIVLVGMVPLAFIAAGVTVWIRRKRR